MSGKLIAFPLLALAMTLLAAEKLPVTPAETLSGEKLSFPSALAGKTSICVFGFSKEAGDRTKIWMTRLTENGWNAWSVANLEKAPSFVRGMIRGSMRKGTPANQLDHSLILTKDLKAWEQAVGSKHDADPVVVLLSPSGTILWTFEGVFSEEAYNQLKKQLDAAH